MTVSVLPGELAGIVANGINRCDAVDLDREHGIWWHSDKSR